MRHRILFVDDEVNILKALQRSLRGKRTEWEMVFEQSGQAALDRLETESFDVIVSDMRMPELDGPALMKQVRHQYPAMGRIILSGYSDDETMVRTGDAAQCYLDKPCDANLLVETIHSLLDKDGRTDSSSQ